MQKNNYQEIPYPWQSKQWQALSAMYQQKRLPHALLLKGLQGLGKFEFAQLFAKCMLCELSVYKDKACGNCKACQLAAAGTHPDLHIIQSEDAGKAIKVDQIRTLVDKLYHTSQKQNYKVMIINPAESMNIAAANALLKTLEEPPIDKTLIMLISDQPANLLATIRSRCQSVVFQAPSQDETQAWLAQQYPNQTNSDLLLALANYAPFRTLELLQKDQLEQSIVLLNDLSAILSDSIDPIKVASEWLKAEFSCLLNWLFFWIKELLYLQFAIRPSIKLEQSAYQQLIKILKKTNKIDLFSFFDYLQQCQHLQNTKINLNQQLQLEALFCKWKEIHWNN